MTGRREVLDVSAYMEEHGLKDEDVISKLGITQGALHAWKQSGNVPWGLRDELWRIARGKEASRQL
jgi:uncharacterized protein YjcR